MQRKIPPYHSDRKWEPPKSIRLQIDFNWFIQKLPKHSKPVCVRNHAKQVYGAQGKTWENAFTYIKEKDILKVCILYFLNKILLCLPSPQVKRLEYSIFPGKPELFFERHSVFIKYLLSTCKFASDFTLEVKLHTEDEGLLGPTGVAVLP